MITRGILPLDSDAATLEIAGGKGANLAMLLKAGFPVPDGFIIPTTAYLEYVSTDDRDRRIVSSLSDVPPDDPVAIENVSRKIRAWFRVEKMDDGWKKSMREAYADLGEAPVAVRSSATTEDLPELSFAGQQDTFLNIIGEQMLFEAIVKCWGSLWTARAISYRARNHISHHDVALAVIVQTMVRSEASGVLFTANPLTGKRTETVIDATIGLGEALVGGMVEPDHYLVDSASGDIINKTLGAKEISLRCREGGGVITEETEAPKAQAIPDDVISRLTEMGQDVSALYSTPQDIEWAWSGDRLHLLQSRPITSLYPVPDTPVDPLIVFASLAVIQGLLAPFTPLGQDVMKMVFAGGARLFDYDFTHETQRVLFSAGERLWVNMTPLMRNPIGRKILSEALPAVAPGVAQTIHLLLDDPNVAVGRGGIRLHTLRRIAGFLLPTMRRVIKLWRNPEGERERLTLLMDETVHEAQIKGATTGDIQDILSKSLEDLHKVPDLFPQHVIPLALPPVIAAMAPLFGILRRFSAQAAESSGDPAFAQAYLEIARGLPHNVTTEMDLGLWHIAQKISVSPETSRMFRDTPAPDLAVGYLQETLPAPAQESLAGFMERYGARGLGEIDIGLPRWNENPTHILQVLQGYLQITDPEKAPDVVFARASESAARAAADLESAVRQLRGGVLKSWLLRWAIGRFRSLAGMRESPKFFAIRLLDVVRQGLLRSGQELAGAGLLNHGDDVFFLTVNELDQLNDAVGKSTNESTTEQDDPNLQTLAEKLRARVIERRARYEREQVRKQIPRILLSDGTTFFEGVRAPGGNEDILHGDPVSPGVVEGVARVIFDPLSTSLSPGEILVCPGTDPAWTPLFLSASGLIMEVGGMMTHGSVVAREFGIPAVVGVDQATNRITSGQRLRLNGSSGEIMLIDDGEEDRDAPESAELA